MPFFLNGHFGVMKGASIAFLTYTRFESPITIAEEAKKPQKDIPRSLTTQIMIETVQYSLLGFLITGFVNIEDLTEKKGQISSTEVSDALI
jgi:basic amino acid/polyamine antiporter, APA family